MFEAFLAAKFGECRAEDRFIFSLKLRNAGLGQKFCGEMVCKILHSLVGVQGALTNWENCQYLSMHLEDVLEPEIYCDSRRVPKGGWFDGRIEARSKSRHANA